MQRSSDAPFGEDYEDPDMSSATIEDLAAVFQFQHHEGSDHTLEMAVFKQILIREGYITRLRTLTKKIQKGEEAVMRNTDGTGDCGAC